jgi:hypothetical protein
MEISLFYYIAIGSACIMSTTYFYCTYKNKLVYSDNDVDRVNIEITQRHNAIIEKNDD